MNPVLLSNIKEHSIGGSIATTTDLKSTHDFCDSIHIPSSSNYSVY